MKENVGKHVIDLMDNAARIIIGDEIIKTDSLKWNEEKNGSSWLSLNEIFVQLNTDEVIYVWDEGPLRGEIFMCNNYTRGVWQEHGETKGYA